MRSGASYATAHLSLIPYLSSLLFIGYTSAKKSHSCERGQIVSNWLVNPFQLGAAKGAEMRKDEEVPRLTLGRQLALYATLILGNIASSFFESYRAGQPWRPNPLSLLFAAIVGIVLLPGAIDANKLNGQKEELVQFAMVFTYGMGWQSLLGAAISAATGTGM